MTAASMFPHRISIITGHYGTGKTELAVNLALALAAEGSQVMLADLDIVNPYFRAKDSQEALAALKLSAAGLPDRSALEQALGGLSSLEASPQVWDRISALEAKLLVRRMSAPALIYSRWMASILSGAATLSSSGNRPPPPYISR